MITGRENHGGFTEILYEKSTVEDTTKEGTGTKTAQDKENPEGSLIGEKRAVFVLIVSVILAAGVLTAGCTQDSGSLQPGESPSGIQALSPSPGRTETGNNDRPPFNMSAIQNRTPPPGMMNGTPPYMNGTPPSDRPFGMNGTPPSGQPPAGVMNRTHPSGTPPSA